MTLDLYAGRDPREIPTYPIAEVARMAGVPRATLRSWVEGRRYPTQSGEGFFAPLIERPDPTSPMLSFVNLIETHVLAALRRQHQVPLTNVRRALDYLRESFPSPHPLAEQSFETDGVDVFIQEYGQLINVSRGGQTEMREMIEAHLRRVERDPQGRPVRLFPFVRRREDVQPQEIAAIPRFIVIDPFVSFGQPVLAGSGIPTAVIADRFQAGESLGELAADYDRSPQHIEEAIRYELAA